MEDMNAKGLYVDDLHKLRVVEPELAAETEQLKGECGDFVEKTAEFRQSADGFIALADEVTLTPRLNSKLGSVSGVQGVG